MSERYIATFYSHFGAIRFKRQCDAGGISAKTMPVPRNLSSSGGTCVCCEGGLPEEFCRDETEQIVKVQESGYQIIYRAEGS